jgi:hypothetical protein
VIADALTGVHSRSLIGFILKKVQMALLKPARPDAMPRVFSARRAPHRKI